MGANARDDILGDEGSASGAGATTTHAGAPSTAAVDPALVSRQVEERLAAFEQKHGANMDRFAQSLGKYVQDALTGAGKAAATNTATPSQQDTVQTLLSDPERVVNELLDKRMAEQLGPWLTNKVNSDFEEQLDRQRKAVDGKFGEGTFDAEYLPEIEAAIEGTPNKSAKGDKKYIQTLVDMVSGKKYDKLSDIQAKYRAKQAEDERSDVSTGVLGPGRRRPRSESVLTDEDRSFMAMVSERSGDDIDMKRIEELMKVKQRDGALDTQNVPGVKNKLSAKGDRARKAAASARA